MKSETHSSAAIPSSSTVTVGLLGRKSDSRSTRVNTRAQIEGLLPTGKRSLDHR